MSFLYPSFLYALFALAIPILLHLFDLQRPKKVVFTNVSLLKNISERTSATRKLRHLWVLIARLLSLTFVILAFAQPYIKGSKNSMLPGTMAVSLYLDNTPSMNQNLESESLLNCALRAVQELIQVLPAAAQYIYTDNFSLPKDRLWLTPEKMKDRLTEVKTSHIEKSAEQIFQKQNFAMQELGQSKQKMFFWFSDFQKSAHRGIQNLPIDSSYAFYFIPVQNTKASNVYVDTVWIESLFLKPNENNTIYIRLKNSGANVQENVHVKLFANEVLVGSISLRIGADSYENTSFSFIPNAATHEYRCRVEIDDEPIHFDNTHYFVLSTSEPIKILGIVPQNEIYLQTLYSNEPTFRYKSNGFGNISLQALKESDLIIVNGFDKLSEAESQMIFDAFETGKNLLLFPSADLLKSKSIRATLLQKLSIGFQIEDEKNFMQHTLEMPDLKNPFFNQVFEKTDKNIDLPKVSYLINWGKRGHTLLKTRSDLPFLSKINFKNKNVFICASPLHNDFTNFQKHSIFVPTMYKIAIESAHQNKNLSYTFNSSNIEIPWNEKKSQIQLRKESFTCIPTQKLKYGKLFFDLPAVPLEPGFYEIVEKDSTRMHIAVNMPKSESEMQFYTSEELKNFFVHKKNIQVIPHNEAINFVDAFRASHVGVSLWKYCVLLALGFLLMEIVLIRIIKYS